MKRFVLFGLVAGLALAVSSAKALVIIDYKTGAILSGTATFSNWTISDVNKNGDPWWDNNSADSGNKNIGDVLNGASVSGFTPSQLSPAPGALPYLHVTGNTAQAVTDWVFQDGVSVGVLRLELAGNANINELGIYKAGSTAAADKIVLFPGPVSPVASKSFSLPASWGGLFGLYMKVGNKVFYSESSLNQGDKTDYQHFALFKGALNQYGAVRWWLGVEDKSYANNPNENNPNNTNRGDYQDIVLTIEAVPDASTLALFLSGLPALALLRRRRA